MDWRQKEKVLREKRTIEATKKSLTGSSGKLGVIAQTLGHKIVQQGSSLYDVNFLDDPYEDDVDTEYETMVSEQNGPVAYRDEILNAHDQGNEEIGWVFDGLSRGMHLEIKYFYQGQRLECSYKGYLVFKEVGGELFAYAPFPEWENLIERLYKNAKTKSNEIKEQMMQELTQKIQKDKQSFWQKLRFRWGV